MAAVEAWPVLWSPYGCPAGLADPLIPYGHHVGVAGLLGSVWLPWGRGHSPGPRMAAVGAWPFPWGPYGCRGGVADPVGPVWMPRGLAGPLTAYGRHGDVAGILDSVRLPWRQCWSPEARMAAVGAWPVPCTPYGRRGGVVIPLGRVWQVLGCGRSLGPHMAAVWAWPVPWASCERCEGVAVRLGPVRPPWRRGRLRGPRMDFVGRGSYPGPVWPPWRRGLSRGVCMVAVGAWPFPWAPYGCCGGVAGFLGLV